MSRQRGSKFNNPAAHLRRGDPGELLFARRRDRQQIAARHAKRSLKPLLHQQFWCWGQDVSHPEGNLLLQNRFTRHRRTEGEPGGTCYALAGDFALWLWGFGLVARQSGSPAVLLRRYEMRPLIVRDTNRLTEMHDLATVLAEAGPPADDGERAAMAQTRAAAFRWIADYERRTLRSTGSSWRTRVVGDMEHALIPADSMAEAWDEVADSLQPERSATRSPLLPVRSGPALFAFATPP
jgi:hypothetical protein